MRILVLSLLLLPTATWADTVFVAGNGPDSCGKVVAAFESGSRLGTFHEQTESGETLVSEKQALMQWVQGFITGVNLSRGPSKQIEADYAAIELWIRNYCTANPTDNLFNAARQFTRSRPGKQGK